MKRYEFLDQEGIFEALNRLRNAFLAAKDGNDVEHIINGLLTHDEKVKIGRRIQVAECLLAGMSTDEIEDLLKVGRSTVTLVGRFLDEHPECFELLNSRKTKIEKEYGSRAYRLRGGSTLVFNRKEYTGFKRKDVKR